MKNVEELVPESNRFCRLHAQLRNRERTLRMRVSELSGEAYRAVEGNSEAKAIS